MVASHLHGGANRDDHCLVIFLAANAINARHTGDDNHVLAREQRTHRRKPQPFNLIVDARVLLDERIGARDVGLRLVIIEITDEIFHSVVRKKTFELGVELRGEGFVVRDDQRRFIEVFDHVGDRECFA